MCSFEGTDNNQISYITFYYNRFSILTNDSPKAVGRFRIHLLLEDNTLSTRYNFSKSDRCSNSPTKWTNLGLIFFVETYGIHLIDDEIDSAQADMCFSKNIITHFLY